MKKLSILIFVATILMSCSESSENNTNPTVKTSSESKSKAELTPGINPPAADLDVPYMNKQLLAENGGSFVYETGSIITFPENAVLHADGTPVEGSFDIEYREFHDPIDIFFSGIPMNYDSAGISYQFISAGMCELKAYQNGEELIVNPKASPSVDMVSKDEDPAHNLYYYDEEASQWLSKGKSEIKDFEEPEEVPEMTVDIPIEPQKIDPQKYSFYISVEELGSEFKGFNNMYFQIADEEKNYDPADAAIQWYSVDVERSTKLKGKYLVTFSNASLTRTYITDPVFNDEEYENAMATYNKVMEEKAEELKKQQEELAAWEATQAKYLEQQRKMDSINKEIAAYNEMVYNSDKKDFDNFEFDQDQYTIQRGFQLSSFGVWNCDNPKFKEENFVVSKVKFKGEGSKLSDEMFSVIYEKYNSVYNGNVGNYRNLPSTNEIVFLIKDQSLYYGKVSSEGPEVAVKLDRMDVSNTSFKEVKKRLMSI